MSVSLRARSAPSSPRTERTPDTGADVAELHFQIPEESGKTHLPPVNKQIIPDELLVSLASAVCNRSSLGQTAHRRHCKACGIRRPDAVWNHPLGRKKYKYFLEQPTSVTGAGRDISFLCDSVGTQRKTAPLPPLTDRSGVGDTQSLSVSESLIPEEYHIVKNKGLQSLELYEDAFTVQLQDDEQKLRVFPSLRPSGRLEAVQLMRMMDDMLMKAGVDQQREELTELSQMEALLELVQVEQNIYNIVFHELIRQVSVNCAERGQLLAKLRQRYQSLFERIPHRLKALHTEVVAQRALDRRLTEEILRIKISIQQLSMELSRIRDHDAFVTQQAEQAHQQLAEALEQTESNSEVVQGYHELYELQRGRLESQLLQMTKDRDHWSQLSFCLALKLISIKKLRMINQLHINEQSWFKTAEHCRLYLNSKDTEDLNIITELTAFWKEQLATLMSQLKRTEYAQCERLNAISQGIAEWLNICTTENKSPDLKNQKTSLETIHAELKQWFNTLAFHSERYQGEKLLCCQRTLDELGRVQERWLNFSHQLLKRHPSPDGEPPRDQQALKELDTVLSELLKQLDKQISRARRIHEQITSLLGLMESWVSNLGQQEMTSVCDWRKLEETLHSWQSLAEKVMQTENENKTEPNIYAMTEEASDKVRMFITSLSRFTDGENHRLSEKASSIHMAQIRWMLHLLVLMVPDYSEDQSSEQDHHYMTNVSLKTLDEDAKLLIEDLDCFSRYITSSCKLILEGQSLQNPQEDESVNEMNECIKLQAECVDWADICLILLSKVKGASVELTVRQADPASSCDAVISPADTMETLVNEEVSAEPTADNKAKDETETELREGELTVCESPVVKLIGSDGNITQRRLGESSVHLDGTEELVVSPATDEAQKAFSDLTTVALLQQELHDSEERVHSAEQRALRVEEALQAALEKIQDLERQLQGRPSLEPKSSEEKEETPPPATPPAPPKKATTEAKATSSKRTKKR